ETVPASRSPSSTRPRRYRSLRGWGTTVLDDDLRLLQSVATFPKQRVRFASTHASAEADGRTRLARDAFEAHGDRVFTQTPRPNDSVLDKERTARSKYSPTLIT